MPTDNTFVLIITKENKSNIQQNPTDKEFDWITLLIQIKDLNQQPYYL